MAAVSGGVKFWAFASCCALLLWIVAMLPANIISFLDVVTGVPSIFMDNPGIFIAHQAALVARLVGVVFALGIGFLVWFTVNHSSSRIERWLETALFLEATYFVLLFPSGLWSLGSGLNFLGVGYVLQAASAGTVLMVLSFKVRGSMDNPLRILKWVGVGAVGYVSALWFNVVFHWFDKIALIGSSFLLRGATAWGFLGSLITMSLAVFFAFVGAWLLSENKAESVRWFGLSLAMIGAHYVVYLYYSFTVGDLFSAMQLDIWTLPFLGLGISLLRVKLDRNLIGETEV